MDLRMQKKGWDREIEQEWCKSRKARKRKKETGKRTMTQRLDRSPTDAVS